MQSKIQILVRKPIQQQMRRRSYEEFQRLQEDNLLYWGSNGTQPVPSIKMFLSEARATPINFRDHEYAGNTDEGTHNLEELFKQKLFNNPKPVKLVQRIIADEWLLNRLRESASSGELADRDYLTSGQLTLLAHHSMKQLVVE